MLRRGQATVELALGSIVIITVVLFGIHFAEVGYLSLKAQDAAAYATWEATGRRVQDLKNFNAAPFNAIIGGPDAVDSAAQRAYRDFNGLESVDTGASVVVKGLTRASGLTVRCTENGALTFRPTTTASKVYFDRGGMSCNAEATLQAAHFAKRVLDGANGFFNAKQYDARGAAAGGSIKVCAVGRAVGGNCPGQLSVLLNDWGLAGDEEKGECRLGVGAPGVCNANPNGSPPSAGNYVYKNAVKQLWAAGWNDSVDFANTFAGGAPASPNEFWFSFAGLESSYNTTNGGEGRGTWNTGGPAGSGVVPFAVNKNCFLGMAGPGCN